jgi:uncharacterized protein YneF (UPF0154 family)
MMNPEVLSALGVIILGVTGGFFGMIRYMIKTLAELKPNSGNSIKDQITRLEKRVDDIYSILAERK